MSVVMEVTDQRHIATHAVQSRAYGCHLRGSLRRVDRDAHQLRTGFGQLKYLLRGSFGIGGIGIGHGLNHDRCATAQHDFADQHPLRRTAFDHHRTHSIVSRATSLEELV